MTLLAPLVVLVAAVFAGLFILRLGGAHRRSVSRFAPAIICAGAAILFAARGAMWIALAFGVASIALYAWSTRESQAATKQARNKSSRSHGAAPPKKGSAMSDAQARAILGVHPGASEADIRSAYRRKMARAHPDLGGSTEEAAQLSAARDALLRR
ncbi:MAG: DnaJ domain-containing protein [Alphaproteobacteria bacterium]|nr:DnaJ domain-containing protein [Alphaproteobacteria bacterium]